MNPDDYISDELREELEARSDERREQEAEYAADAEFDRQAAIREMRIWDEPPSNCCGAPALGEIFEGFAPCSDCKEMAEFKMEEEE